MANPADNLTKVTPNLYQSANRQLREQVERTIHFIRDTRTIDVYVKTKNATSSDEYTVDLYENGFGAAPTGLGFAAFAISGWDDYTLWSPGKAVIQNNKAYLVPSMQLFFLKKRVASPDTTNVIEGWPCDEDGNCHSSIQVDAQVIKVNWAFPYNATDAGNPKPTVAYWAWLRYPKPYTHDSITTAGVVLFGAGSSIPAPTRKYVVYTPIDDTLVPTWQDIRFA